MKKLGTLLLFIPLFAFAQTTTISNQYKRAEEYALSLNADSAFKLLFSLAYNYNFKDYEKLSTNEQFETLTSDNRWLKLLTIVERNELNYLKLDQKLILILDTIHKEDQEPRNAIPGIEERYGKESKELKNHWKTIDRKDSINLYKVEKILKERGWLGPDIIGEKGNSTLFLIIQHSPVETQVKYLPMMQKAAKKGDAKWTSLALLEDRVHLKTGKKQIYGSQIGRDKTTGEYFIYPIRYPDKVDERRRKIGLIPLDDYLKNWNLKWDSLKHIERNNKSDSRKLTGVWKYLNTTNKTDSKPNTGKKELFVFFYSGRFQKIVHGLELEGTWKVDRNKLFLTTNNETEAYYLYILIKKRLILSKENSPRPNEKIHYIRQK